MHVNTVYQISLHPKKVSLPSFSGQTPNVQGEKQKKNLHHWTAGSVAFFVVALGMGSSIYKQSSNILSTLWHLNVHCICKASYSIHCIQSSLYSTLGSVHCDMCNESDTKHSYITLSLHMTIWLTAHLSPWLTADSQALYCTVLHCTAG